MNQQFYTIEEIALILKVSKMTVYRWIRSGKLPAYQFGREYRISTTDYVQFLMSFKVGSNTEGVMEQP